MPVKKLQTDQQIISETVAAIMSCRTISKAADLLKLERSTLYDRMAKFPEIKEAVIKIKENAGAILANSTEKAAQVMVDGLDDKNQKYDAAKYILDGVGITKQKGDGNVNVHVVTAIQNKREEYDI